MSAVKCMIATKVAARGFPVAFLMTLDLSLGYPEARVWQNLLEQLSRPRTCAMECLVQVT